MAWKQKCVQLPFASSRSEICYQIEPLGRMSCQLLLKESVERPTLCLADSLVQASTNERPAGKSSAIGPGGMRWYGQDDLGLIRRFVMWQDGWRKSFNGVNLC